MGSLSASAMLRRSESGASLASCSVRSALTSGAIPVLAVPKEQSFEEAFEEYCRDLPKNLPAAAVVELLQEMESVEQKKVRAGHCRLHTCA